MSRLTTVVADATVTIITADAVDASCCHDSYDNENATETNGHDSDEEKTEEPMSTYSDEY